VLASERPQGAFSRQLFLGDSLDVEHVDASYDDSGELTVRIPVADEGKPRKVDVAAGGAAKQLDASSSAA
jgi:HSP20 family protein